MSKISTDCIFLDTELKQCLFLCSGRVAHKPFSRLQTGNIQITRAKRPSKVGDVTYGKDWYKQTRDNARRFSTVKEELDYYRKANRQANNGRERKDLYTENWSGDRYQGSPFNVLTVIALISILVPIAGLIFAWQTYGVLWG